MRKSSKKKVKVVAILTADWHLSHNPPVWRSNEPDWYRAMARPLYEISRLAIIHRCPVLIVGDIFDKWNSPAELINFAMKAMNFVAYAVPGQHDLPNHNIKELSRSAFASLTISETISYIDGTCWNGMRFEGFPFGKPIEKALGDCSVALCHDYVWISGHSYKGAPKEKRVAIRPKSLVHNKYYGYDVVVYGDNHKGFMTQVGDTIIFNCGTLMRRKSDEKDYKPQVGLLYADGSVEPHYLDTSEDKHLTAEQVKKAGQTFEDELDMTNFAKELRELGSTALDFAEAMENYCRTGKVAKKISSVINKAMGN